ncbi:MAG: Spy/CpxP family protein refolding chaperone [Bacteroidia bacterium]|nr:Spy/CpxP family protein refolding chaperone [Bacteroidia bacterium]
MKTLILITAFITLGVSLNAQADNRDRRIEQQRRTSRVVTVEDRVTSMHRALDLTDKQKTDLTQYFNDLDAERAKMLESARESRAERRAEADKRQKANEEKLKSILGNEKYEIWQKTPRAGTRQSVVATGGIRTRSGISSARAASGRQPATAEQQADRLTKRLNLSENQKNELIGFFEKNKKARNERRSNENMTRNERRLEAEKASKEHAAELEKILGAEKYKELIDSRTERRIDKRE